MEIRTMSANDLIGLGSLLHEILSSIPTIVKGFRETYDEITKMKDKKAARRDMKVLENISDRFSSLIFEKDGIRSRVKEYVDHPDSRPTWSNLESALNHSQEVYNDALKTLKLTNRFKARYPTLGDKLGTYHKAKGRILTGIGNATKPAASKQELTELRNLDAQFDLVNRGIKEIRDDIKECLLKFDREANEKN
jgi:hypothetical protein